MDTILSGDSNLAHNTKKRRLPGFRNVIRHSDKIFDFAEYKNQADTLYIIDRSESLRNYIRFGLTRYPERTKWNRMELFTSHLSYVA